MNTKRDHKSQPDQLSERYDDVRKMTLSLSEHLSDADATVQSMEDASPAKWHLAHTTWFFETLILREFAKGYQIFNDRYPFLFNSYYNALGDRQPRPKRGMLTRPTLDEVLSYRQYVDEAMTSFLAGDVSEDALNLLELGLNHEQQHQELLLTDILHLFAQNPLKPEFRPAIPLEVKKADPSPLNWMEFDGGLHEFGHDGDGFAFDAEGPKHHFHVAPFKLATRCVSNREWIDFIDQGGYQTPTIWLSDGWDRVQAEGWQAPLYWEKIEDTWWSMTLRGLQPVDLDAPVTHICYFEADAYARFKNKRLPTEYEWELASKGQIINGNMLASDRLRPAPAHGDGLVQMYGDVWEWTQSPFTPYPGFKPAHGAIGEYNGKFMCGQYVLRGGSCVTPPGHMRATYRNFFHPDKRWQFTGLRLAEDL
ncbi:ergothioneine biosynthesis protein EgtB [Terasakiella sp. A23]|uniref:ergothioneine biosynthesis protein EgtB n=1 Tax=Terasakiella sp. FCG-A23 TaxID=3080561 RepID=UPI00295596F2|nr:ergothioneine biosynthesis protein EgtB [Terasakiella sp. A23]MDV7338535.1 ergothioneine biosynthesis protein EgtB [Terasakiella sp. A23]